MFANQRAFDDPASYRMATGVDLRQKNAIIDTQGNILIHAQTGGMIHPQRHELQPGAKVFRFGGKGASAQSAAKGGWWVEKAEFETMLSFANTHGLSIGMAARLLCLVPPEWSDMSLLVRCGVRSPLLAWRGLGNSVVTPRAGGGLVDLPHHNEIAARRLHQLFIPGLADIARDALAIEASYVLDPKESLQGWIYI